MKPQDWKDEAFDLARYQWRAFALAVIVLFTVYLMSLFVAPGIVTAVLVMPACLIVLLTCFAWLNDMGPEDNGWIDHARRIGLSLLGGGIVLVAASVFALPYVMPWRGVILIWGMALVFLTQPKQIPWWDYITGRHREYTGFRDHLGRFTGSVKRLTGELNVGELEEAIQRKEMKKDAGKDWNK